MVLITVLSFIDSALGISNLVTADLMSRELLTTAATSGKALYIIELSPENLTPCWVQCVKINNKQLRTCIGCDEVDYLLEWKHTNNKV